jgi:hypothetical protein
MRCTRLRVRLSRADGRTRYLLTGTLPDRLPRSALHQLFSLLSYWSEERLHVVLCADDPAWWLEEWSDALAEIPERHLCVSFRLGSGDRYAE